MNDDFVFVDELVSGVRWDAKYATWDNFTGKPVDGYVANRIVGTRALCAALEGAREAAAPWLRRNPRCRPTLWAGSAFEQGVPGRGVGTLSRRFIARRVQRQAEVQLGHRVVRREIGTFAESDDGSPEVTRGDRFLTDSRQ